MGAEGFWDEMGQLGFGKLSKINSDIKESLGRFVLG